MDNNPNQLYPVIHDLTDAEYSASGCNYDDDGICSIVTDASGSIQDLLYQTSGTSVSSPPRHVSNQSVDSLLDISVKHSKSDNFLNDCEQVESTSCRTNQDRLFKNFYVLTRQVDRSRRSTVWESIHRQTGLRYATKIIDRRCLVESDEDAVYNEIETLNFLAESPTGTLHLVDFFDERTHFYIVTDYIQDGNLKMQIVDKQLTISEKQARNLVRSLLEGVGYLHSIGICHRNLKPENVLVGDSVDMKSVFLTGFSLAARLHQEEYKKKSGLLTDRCGTVSYVAPEVLRGSPYSTKVDCWSIGVIVYMVLCGRHPFGGDMSASTLIENISTGTYEFSSQDRSNVSFLARDFVYRLLQVDSDIRMSIAQALEHPWLCNHSHERLPKIDEDITEFSSRRPLFKNLGGRMLHFWGKLAHDYDDNDTTNACLEIKHTGSTTTASFDEDTVVSAGSHCFLGRSLYAVAKFASALFKRFSKRIDAS
mmetsp:Transcript_19768/g.30506  ORF Transcript_19768/g.30506 Transcript_19768/m.30506 type:complete len:480 (+) Transcript_19768:200-1639(+)